MPAAHSTTSIEFRDIIGDPGYQVGSNGTVRSCWAGGCRPRLGTTWKFIKPCPSNKCGHLKVSLRRTHKVYVHKLVLEAFVGPCPDGLECRHIDGNPANNRIDNLAWGTHSENCQDAIRHGTSICTKMKGEKIHTAKLTEDDVREIRLMWSQGIISQINLGKKFGVGRDTINSIIIRKTWKHIK